MARKVTFQGDERRTATVFGIPDSGVGREVVKLPLTWAWVDNHFQAIIYHRELQYPHCELATAREIELMVGGAR